MPNWHITIATDGRGTMFAAEPARRAAVRALARVGGDRLLLFGIVDDHVHLVVTGEARVAADLAGAASRSLAALGCPELATARVRPVEGRAHLESLVGYVARQVRKHGIDAHPAVWSGTCAPDLLGARRIATFDPTHIARELPRARIAAMVAEACHVPLSAVEPASRADLAATAPDALWTLTAAAAALDPAAPGRSPEAVQARIAWAHLTGLPVRALADDTGLPTRTLRHWRAQPPPALIAVIARRWTLDRWLGALDKKRIAREHAPPD